MKIAIVCLMAVLLCSCRQSTNERASGMPANTEEREKEVRDTITAHFHRGAGTIRGPLTAQRLTRSWPRLARKTPHKWYEPVRVGGPEWDQLKAKLKKGDELYFYKSDLRSWAYLAGQGIRGNSKEHGFGLHPHSNELSGLRGVYRFVASSLVRGDLGRDWPLAPSLCPLPRADLSAIILMVDLKTSRFQR